MKTTFAVWASVSLMYLAIVAIGDKIVRDVLHQLGELLLHILHERRAAGAGQEALFGQVPSIRPEATISAPRAASTTV